MLIPNLGTIDHLYACLKEKAARTPDSLMFSQGWGDHAAAAEVRDRILSGNPPAAIQVQWESGWTPYRGYFARDGRFETPFFQTHLPPESRTAYFRLVLPEPTQPCPVYVHMATSGEEAYRRRENRLAMPLLRQGLGSLMLEHPYLGRRRPSGQSTTNLHHVSDLLLLGGTAVEEARSLLQWLHAQGVVHLGVTGVSIGGHFAALAGVLTSFDIAIVPCVAPHSAVPVFTEGLIRKACNWTKLAEHDSAPGQARCQMREYLGFTELERFPRPRNTGAAIVIAALDDQFVPRYSAELLSRHWPDAEFRWISGGHVSSIVGRNKAFISALSDAMSALGKSLAAANEVAGATSAAHGVQGPAW